MKIYVYLQNHPTAPHAPDDTLYAITEQGDLKIRESAESANFDELTVDDLISARLGTGYEVIYLGENPTIEGDVRIAFNLCQEKSQALLAAGEPVVV